MVYIVMAYIIMAYTIMAYIVMAYIVMAYIVMTHICSAREGQRFDDGTELCRELEDCAQRFMLPKQGNVGPRDGNHPTAMGRATGSYLR